MSCALCEVRKEKRFCPAVHGRICPQCCGENREVTLDCPTDCAYLRQAREHETARPLQALDQGALFPQIEITQRFLQERQHFIMGLSFALAKAARADRSLHDPDLIAALTSMARTSGTLVNSGLHYEGPGIGLHLQAINTEIQNLIREYREVEQKNVGYSRLTDSDILYALVFVIRMAHARTNGRPKSRAFIEFLLAQFRPAPAESGTVREAGSSLIIP